MKRFLTSAIILSILALTAAAAPKASELVSSAAARLRAAKSVTISFTATGTDSSAGGTMVISGNKFVIESRDAKVWYDGNTQWTWSASADEVDITEPTPEEIAQVNPYAIISSLSSRYKAKYLGPPSKRTVVLTPSMPNPQITRAEIVFGVDGLPSRMTLTMDSGQKITLAVASLKISDRAPDSSIFVFSQAKAPGAEIVDLR